MAQPSSGSPAAARPAYPAPRSSTEMGRLHKQHHWCKAVLSNRLVLAPVPLDKPHLRVLDSGTADGYWLLDLLPSLAPSAECVGTDIAPQLFPPATELPPNVTLRVQSITEAWPQEWTGTFDFVHQRAVLANVGEDELDLVIGRMVALLKPGGWIQLVETDGRNLGQDPARRDSAVTQLAEAFAKFFGLAGQRIGMYDGIRDVLYRLGLEDVQYTVAELAVGKGAPTEELVEMGLGQYLGMADVLRTIVTNRPGQIMTFKDGTSITPDILDDIYRRLGPELRSNGARTVLHVAWGRKAA